MPFRAIATLGRPAGHPEVFGQWCARRDPRLPAGRSSRPRSSCSTKLAIRLPVGGIIERAEMTKGALYYHFDSKESLATAIIEEGSVRLAEAFRGIAASSAPALETIIHGVFVVET